MIDFTRLALPPGYSLEHEVTTIYALKAPSGGTVQRFSLYDDDNQRVEMYAWRHYNRYGGEES